MFRQVCSLADEPGSDHCLQQTCATPDGIYWCDVKLTHLQNSASIGFRVSCITTVHRWGDTNTPCHSNGGVTVTNQSETCRAAHPEWYYKCHGVRIRLIFFSPKSRSSAITKMRLAVRYHINSTCHLLIRPPSSRPSRSGVLRTQKLKPHLLRSQSSKVLPLKPGVGHDRAMHASPTAGNSSLN